MITTYNGTDPLGKLTTVGTATSITAATPIGTTTFDDLLKMVCPFDTNTTTKKEVKSIKSINFPSDIKTVHINDKKKVVTVVFANGSKGIARCHPNDEFDPVVGFCTAVTYALFKSRTQCLKYVNNKVKEQKDKDSKKK